MLFIKKEDRLKAKEVKKILGTLINTHSNWEDIAVELDRLFERISDRDDKDYDAIYDYIDILKSPIKEILCIIKEKKKWAVNVCLTRYSKTPNHMVVWVDRLENNGRVWLPTDSGAYILKQGDSNE